MWCLIQKWKLKSQKSEIEIRRLARTGSEQEILVGSSELLQENYFFLSEILIDKLLTINPTSCNYNYRKGFVLLALNENFENLLKLSKNNFNNICNYSQYSWIDLLDWIRMNAFIVLF